MDQKNLQSKKIPRIKIAGAILVVFGFAMLFANTAQASATGGNFFETGTQQAVGVLNQFAAKVSETAGAIGDNLREGAGAAAESLQNGLYAVADQPIFGQTWNAVNSVRMPALQMPQIDFAVFDVKPALPDVSFARADLSSFFGQVKCFFGFGCETAKTAESPKVEGKTQTQNSSSQSAINPAEPITEAEAPNMGAAPIADMEATAQIGGTDGTQIEDVPTTPQTESKTVTIIQPTKEIQTIHTVTNNTNTVVVDEDIKAKVNLLLRQLDSDRPSFSLGQSFTMPSNLSGKTLNIGSSNFIVDDDGNVNAQTITTAGNVIVQGNFTVSGAQTFSGATALNAATAGPLFAIDQTGAGAALRADNLTFKDSAISTDDTDTALLLNPNGTGAVQFHNTGNYIDSTGNLVLAGGITTASLNAGAGAIQTTGAISGATFNGLTPTSLATGFSIAGGTASKTLTLSDNATLSGSNTGDQTITLTGDVTGTGTGSFGATIANNAVTFGKMQNVSAANRLLGRATAGSGLIEEITVGGDLTQSGSNFTVNNGAVNFGKMANLAANSIIGNNTGSAATPTALSISDVRNLLSLNSVENTALTTWPGSANITTLGTIGTGTWNASAIADDKLASALTGKTYNGLTPTSLATGFSIAGGTASKTLTLSDNATLSGTNSGDQTITLTGAVTGTGTGSFATTLTGAGLDNIFSSNGLLKRTGAGAYTIDASTYLTTTGSAANLTNFPTLNQSTSGNAATATALQNPRSIFGISFNGTADIGSALGTGAYATIANYLPLSGGTMTGNLLFTDNTLDIGASAATRPRTGYFGTSVISPLVTTPSITTASGDLTLDPFGNVIIKGSTADNLAAALNITNSTPASLLFARNDGNIGINNILPGRKLDITETTSATPQLRLTSDSSNYAEMYVDSVGGLFLDTTGSSATNISILDQNLKVCTGGSFGASTCPTTGFNITGTGNLVVAGQVAATDYQRICPTGYIWVPGSAKYGTMPGFCVMKYEAKNVGGVATSQTALTPWTSTTQIAARSACRALGAGYHLISDQEWMTIADNAANTGSNWFGGTVGTNFMYSGHNDNGPAGRLAASTDDDGYSGTGDSASACDGVYSNFAVGDDTITGRACAGQKRTYTLSNGNVIWDISGNVWEWTDAYIYDSDGTKEMPLPATGWLEYTAVTNYKGLNYIRPQDTSWSATQSIGRIYTDSNCAYGSDGAGGYNETCGVYDHNYHAFIRGGDWNDGADAGPLTLYLYNSPSYVYYNVGFRCAR